MAPCLLRADQGQGGVWPRRDDRAHEQLLFRCQQSAGGHVTALCDLIVAGPLVEVVVEEIAVILQRHRVGAGVGGDGDPVPAQPELFPAGAAEA
ncbi:hypothetical protein CVM50_13010 [Pseudooceanicola marinus]|nr:hypothetical protein CVM50_13010 [Pseudooceanicola marinus]